MIVPPHVLAAIRQPAFVYRREGIIAAANDRAEALVRDAVGNRDTI